ncbi:MULTISPECIES: YicC/YloC family endoribonuclease [unclassified Caulobacter]|uniref:YicC/YloC family endoribonuclease n=1 Tax=unclassified Caulobacter TaxID=2648921 RepID=UPI000D3B2A07|nr:MULTISPECIES: YicC/YloC family endoribonuclease [unclassified Caulobacter]PTS91842.1 YicC family protein [Caulobacter sp. HMWF009]PTT10051.1 YicC family protein [Caulobacter sp. HMWF025]
MALSGMTGFARVEGALGAWSWAVEARSVNGRNLDTRFRGPPGFEALDRQARDGAQARFQRGQLTVNIQAKRAESSGQTQISVETLERYLKAGAPYVATGMVAKPSLDGLLGLRGVIEVREEDDDGETRAAVEAAMAASLGEALEALKQARLEEGQALSPVLNGQVDTIERLTREAGVEAAGQPAVLKERFSRRMSELLGEAAAEDRIVQEAAALAIKADVREELDRLTGHVVAARALLGGEAAAGRRLDFLSQEFMRESNTLCSKSALSSLTAIGLELKAVIEQFREQVQNVE